MTVHIRDDQIRVTFPIKVDFYKKNHNFLQYFFKEIYGEFIGKTFSINATLKE